MPESMTGETILKAARPPRAEPMQPSKRMMTAMERDAEARIARALDKMRRDMMRGVTAENVYLLPQRLGQREILQPFTDAFVAVLRDIALGGSAFGQEQIQRQIFGTRKQTPVPFNPEMDWELANTDAAEWARRYGYDWAGRITRTTQQRVQREVAAWIENGEPLSKLRQKLSAPNGPFSPSRARTIAVTETTRAFAEGNSAAWRESGVVAKRQWSTAVDELVCPICGPLHNVQADLGKPFPGGYDNPPAHPNCRCGILPVIPEDVEVLETGLDQFGLQPTATGHEDTPRVAGESLGYSGAGRKMRENLEDIDKDWGNFVDGQLELDELHRESNRIHSEVSGVIERYQRGDIAFDEHETLLSNLQKSKTANYNKTIAIANDLDKIKNNRGRAMRRAIASDNPSDIEFLNRFGMSDKSQFVINTNHNIDELNNMIDAGTELPDKIDAMITNRPRAYFDPGSNMVFTGDMSPAREFIHESGHWIENNNDDIRAEVERFYKRRTKNEVAIHMDEAMRIINDSTIDYGYAADEVTKIDEFIDPYMGKQYRNATEITSMGLEYMYNDAALFARKDPDMFDFIWEVVMGRS